MTTPTKKNSPKKTSNDKIFPLVNTPPDLQVIEQQIEKMDDQELGQFYNDLENSLKYHEEVRNHIKSEVPKRGSVPLPDGYKLVETTRKTKKIDTPSTLKYLLSLSVNGKSISKDDLLKAVKLNITNLKQCITSLADKGDKNFFYEKVLKDLREGGMLKEEISKPYVTKVSDSDGTS